MATYQAFRVEPHLFDVRRDAEKRAKMYGHNGSRLLGTVIEKDGKYAVKLWKRIDPK